MTEKLVNHQATTAVPAYAVDASWPKTLPNDWIMGACAGIAVDAKDNVWVVHRPRTLTEREAGAAQKPPLAECCWPAPSVLQFDTDGNLLRAWGSKDNAEGLPWPQNEHGAYVDHEGNVWTASNGREDHVVLKHTPEGKRLLTIGQWGKTGGSADVTTLGQATDMCVDPVANEVYISDGYGNRRVIVYDSRTGAYKRHWGAYGKTPDDTKLPPYNPDAPPDLSWRSPVHAVRIDNEGTVYIADRTNNRIQVFKKDGTFIKEAFLATRTLAMGSIWDMDFSPDPAQTFMFVPDGTNMKVWILRRDTLEMVGAFGRGGRQAGQFEWVHNIACDSQGNLYTAEVNTGKRVQKFVQTKSK